MSSADTTIVTRQPPRPAVVLAAPFATSAPVVIAAPLAMTLRSVRGFEHDERDARRGAAAEHCPVAEPPPPVARPAPIDGHAS